MFNESDTSRLEEAKQNIQKKVSYACNLLKKTLEINVGDEVLIREDIIYEHSSSTWYLPQIQTYGKKLEINYSIFGKVILVKDDTVLVMILQSNKFENGTLILVKSETIKILNSSVNQALNA